MFQGVHCEQLVVVSLHYVLACFVGALKTYDYQVFTTKIERINSAKKPQSSIVQRLNIQPRGTEFFTATRLIYQTRNTFLCQLIRPAVKLLNSQEPFQVIAQIRVSSTWWKSKSEQERQFDEPSVLCKNSFTCPKILIFGLWRQARLYFIKFCFHFWKLLSQQPLFTSSTTINTSTTFLYFFFILC